MQEITQIIKKDMVPALGVTEPGAIAFAVAKAKTTFVHHLLKLNGEKIISADAKKTASLLCNGAIEARVLGLNYPAMSITGSGAHGIMATLPLYAEYAVKGLSEEKLLRATVLSFLICMYIKAYSGRLSALCGCAIAGGTGAACGLCYLRGGGEAARPLIIWPPVSPA